MIIDPTASFFGGLEILTRNALPRDVSEIILNLGQILWFDYPQILSGAGQL